MWTAEVTRRTKATKQRVWQLWTDAEHWNIWDKDVEYASIQGEFTTGAVGTIKPVGGPKTTLKILHCDYEKGFTSRTTFPLCTMDFIHCLAENGREIEITHRIEISGPLAFLFSKIIGKNIAKGLPRAVDTFINIAEKYYDTPKVLDSGCF